MGKIKPISLSAVCVKVAKYMIKFYQWGVSPFLQPRCRFYPSCSNYALSALEHMGVLRGGFFAFRRILRCHPWSDGGYDPLILSKESAFISQPKKEND